MAATYKPDTTISKVWKDPTMRKVFLDIIHQTQLRKCKPLRGAFFKLINRSVHRNKCDAEIYQLAREFVESLPEQTRSSIQHRGHYRGLNRSNEILNFAKQFGPSNVQSVLDIGCGDGSITKVIRQKFNLNPDQIHGCDILPLTTSDFTFSLITASKLPYQDESFDVIYALMSLHHIRDLPEMLREIRRVLRSDGVLIVREHDCVSSGLSDVLDIVHGFYSMVWCNPQEHVCFQDEYFGHYRTADEFDILIEGEAKLQRVLGTNRHEDFPLYYFGNVINPMKHYWVVYKKINIANTNANK